VIDRRRLDLNQRFPVARFRNRAFFNSLNTEGGPNSVKRSDLINLLLIAVQSVESGPHHTDSGGDRRPRTRLGDDCVTLVSSQSGCHRGMAMNVTENTKAIDMDHMTSASVRVRPSSRVTAENNTMAGAKLLRYEHVQGNCRFA
jgi:hypothetical protein